MIHYFTMLDRFIIQLRKKKIDNIAYIKAWKCQIKKKKKSVFFAFILIKTEQTVYK